MKRRIKVETLSRRLSRRVSRVRITERGLRIRSRAACCMVIKEVFVTRSCALHEHERSGRR